MKIFTIKNLLFFATVAEAQTTERSATEAAGWVTTPKVENQEEKGEVPRRQTQTQNEEGQMKRERGRSKTEEDEGGTRKDGGRCEKDKEDK